MGKFDLIFQAFAPLRAFVQHYMMLDERRCLSCGVPYRLGSYHCVPTGFEKSIESERRSNTERCASAVLCPSCVINLRQTPCSYCPLCGQVMPFLDTEPVWCGACLREHPPWESLSLLGQHTGFLRELVVRAKFGGNLALLSLLGKMLATSLPTSVCADITMIVPLPLHISRLRERGFNQCVEIGRACLPILECPLCLDGLERIVATKHQIGLRDDARQANVRGAFLADEDVVRNARILLLDDTMTTGATLHQAAKALQKAGAAAVHVGVITRTQRI